MILFIVFFQFCIYQRQSLTHATIEVHTFFSKASSLEESNTFSKNTTMQLDEQFHGLLQVTRNTAKHNQRYIPFLSSFSPPGKFGSTKRATSIVARVPGPIFTNENDAQARRPSIALRQYLIRKDGASIYTEYIQLLPCLFPPPFNA